MHGAAAHQGDRAFDRIRWFQVYNDSGEVIPPYAVMEFRGGLTTLDVPKVHKPSENSQITMLCFNGPASVPIGETFNATVETPGWVAWADDGSGCGTGSGNITPAAREVWGTEAGSWYLHSDQMGFVVIGVVTNDQVSADGVNRMLVMFNPLDLPDEGSGSGGSVSHEFLECHPETGQQRTTTFTFPAGMVSISSTEWA